MFNGSWHGRLIIPQAGNPGWGGGDSVLAFTAGRSLQAIVAAGGGSVQDNTSHIGETAGLQAAEQPLTPRRLSLMVRRGLLL